MGRGARARACVQWRTRACGCRVLLGLRPRCFVKRAPLAMRAVLLLDAARAVNTPFVAAESGSAPELTSQPESFAAVLAATGLLGPGPITRSDMGSVDVVTREGSQGVRQAALGRSNMAGYGAHAPTRESGPKSRCEGSTCTALGAFFSEMRSSQVDKYFLSTSKFFC